MRPTFVMISHVMDEENARVLRVVLSGPDLVGDRVNVEPHDLGRRVALVVAEEANAVPQLH